MHRAHGGWYNVYWRAYSAAFNASVLWLVKGSWDRRGKGGHGVVPDSAVPLVLSVPLIPICASGIYRPPETKFPYRLALRLRSWQP